MIGGTAWPRKEGVRTPGRSRTDQAAPAVYFRTVLGPEANEPHRDHFHFDLATRRRSALCQ